MKRRIKPNNIIWPGIILIIFLTCCLSNPVSALDSAEDDTSVNEDKKAEIPDYNTAFDTETVHEILITIDPDDWQSMQDEMEEKYGEFGVKEDSDRIENPRNMTPDADMKRPEGMNGMPGSEENPSYVPASVTYEGTVFDQVGIRYKGQMSLGSSWSEGSHKISFKLDFNQYKDEYPETEDQSFFGFTELNLQSEYGDESLMHNMLASEIFNDAGVITPEAAFYKVFVDYGEGPVYFGLYTLMESVDDTVIKTRFSDDSGNVYKPEGTGASFAEGTFDTDAFEKKTNEEESDWSDVENLYDILNSPDRTEDPQNWREELESVFDVQNFLLWLATNTVIQNWDTYGSNCRNFYLYTDPSTGIITWIPWDFNFAFKNGMGNNGPLGEGGIEAGEQIEQDGEISPSNQHFPGFNISDFPDDAQAPPGNQGMMNNMGRSLSLNLTEAGDNWPLINYLADDPEYYADYLQYLEYVVTGPYNPDNIQEIIQDYDELIRPHVIGEYGEIEGYTYLQNSSEYEEAVTELIDHTYQRYDTVIEFLESEGYYE